MKNIDISIRHVYVFKWFSFQMYVTKQCSINLCGYAMFFFCILHLYVCVT